MSWKLKLVTTLAAVLAACSADPYAGQPEVRTSNNKPEYKEVMPAFGIDAPDYVTLTEETEGSIAISGRVETGQPVLTIDNLPAVATWDAKEGVLKWKPAHNDGIDPANPAVTTRVTSITVTLRSTLDPKSVVQKVIPVIITHKPATLAVSFDVAATVHEGEENVVRLKVESADFPKGPFTVSVADLPEHMRIHQDRQDPSLYFISYKPDFHVVTNSNGSTNCTDPVDNVSRLCRNTSYQIKVQDPRGGTVTSLGNFRVLDMRQAPIVTAPESLDVPAAASEVTFFVYASDPNIETTPSLSVSLEDAKVELVRQWGSKNVDNQVMYKVTWPIPSSETSGAKAKITACAVALRDISNCTVTNLTISLK